MERIPANIISIKAIDTTEEDSPPQSKIYFNEKETETLIDGAILEVCIKVNGFYLVFMTDDIPFEETLRIYLLNQDAFVLDSMALGAIYYTGSFKLLELIEPNLITFEFIGETIWKLSIFNERKFHIPFLLDPLGVWRKKMRFSSYLKIDSSSKTESPM